MNLMYLFAAFLLVLVSKVEVLPVFDILFRNSQGGYKNSYNRRPKGRSYASGGGYNDYKRICKVINPDPYAFIGSNPYPGAPFCPP